MRFTFGNGLSNSRKTLQIVPKLIEFKAFSFAIGRDGVINNVLWFCFKYPRGTEMYIKSIAIQITYIITLIPFLI